jgi:hypothetical protein
MTDRIRRLAQSSRPPITAPSLAFITAILLVAALLPTHVRAQAGGAPARSTQGIEAYVSDDALQAMYLRRMNMGEFGTNDVRVGFFTNQERDLILLGDFLTNIGRSGRYPNWSLQAGSRMFIALMSGPENEETFAVSLGGTLSYSFGRSDAASISISGFYAPEILAFGNAENVVDTMVRFETRLTESMRFFVGYRSLEFNQPEGDREVDDGVHLGVMYRF